MSLGHIQKAKKIVLRRTFKIVMVIIHLMMETRKRKYLYLILKIRSSQANHKINKIIKDNLCLNNRSNHHSNHKIAKTHNKSLISHSKNKIVNSY